MRSYGPDSWIARQFGGAIIRKVGYAVGAVVLALVVAGFKTFF